LDTASGADDRRLITSIVSAVVESVMRGEVIENGLFELLLRGGTRSKGADHDVMGGSEEFCLLCEVTIALVIDLEPRVRSEWTQSHGEAPRFPGHRLVGNR
jgi:hypothetical protein